MICSLVGAYKGFGTDCYIHFLGHGFLQNAGYNFTELHGSTTQKIPLLYSYKTN
jgi:hypothetical protein